MIDDKKGVKLLWSEAIPVFLEGPKRGPVIGMILKDPGPNQEFKEFKWHARVGNRIVGHSETYLGALRNVLLAWIQDRVDQEMLDGSII